MTLPRTLVITPTLNEADNVEQHARRVFEALPEASLLIVDDDSPDRTWEIAGQLASIWPSLHVIRRLEDHGFAFSYLEGFRWANERGFERVVMMDADGSHPASTLPRMVEASAGSDFVVGSRYRDGGSVADWQPARVLLSSFANRYAGFWTRVPCRDLTSGFNCFRPGLLGSLPRLRSDGYAFQIELKFQAHRHGAVFQEIPICFSGRLHGKSKLSSRHLLEGVWRPPALRLGRNARA